MPDHGFGRSDDHHKMVDSGDGGPDMPMPLIPDIAVFQRKLATLPLATYQAGRNRTQRFSGA
jgi:hypothetical protein